MKYKSTPQAQKPSVMNLFWIGTCLILVGTLKILDLLTGMVDSDSVLIPSLWLYSFVFIGVGILLLIFDYLLKRPARARKSLAEIRASQAKQDPTDAESGFTLIEVIVAVGLVALVFGMISGVLVSVIEVNKSINQRVDSEKIGHGVLGLLQRELQGCIAYGLGPVVFKGDDKNLSGGEADEIFFVTTAPGDVFDAEPDTNSSANSSLQNSSNDDSQNQNVKPEKRVIYRKVAYVVRQAPGNTSSRFVLCRRSVAYTKEDRDVTSSGGAPFVEVVDGLVDFKLEYRDGIEGNWQDSWTETNRLPSSIRVSVRAALPEELVRAANEDGREVPQPKSFQTTISVFASTDIPETDDQAQNSTSGN